jgi:nicotinamidase/pyrazinamidase
MIEPKPNDEQRTALIVVDPLKDFCEGGALAVPDARAIFPVINSLLSNPAYHRKILVREEHPENHISFATRHGKEPFQPIKLSNGREQMLWPPHCVKGTEGAELHPDLDISRFDVEFKKGQRSEAENYSGFRDEDGIETGLAVELRQHGITHVDVVGLALDYCVIETAIDAKKVDENFCVRVIRKATRGIDASKGDIERAIIKMKKAGVIIK